MRARGTLLIAIAALALWAVPAEAAKLRSVRKTADAVVGSTAVAPLTTVVARCPKGTKAVSGGYTTSVPQLSSHWFTVSESIMTSNGNGWRVSGTEHSVAPATDTVTAHAYCEQRQRSLLTGSTIRTDFIPSEPGKTTGNTAQCPEATKVVSGGFTTGDPGAYFYSSFGSGRNWGVSVTRVSGTFESGYDVLGFCVRAKVKTVSAAQSLTGPAGTMSAALATPCPKGSALLGGGFQTSQPVLALENAALVFDDSLAGKAWRVSAVSTGGMPETVTAFGYCRPR
jgi:hypothetical protein